MVKNKTYPNAKHLVLAFMALLAGACQQKEESATSTPQLPPAQVAVVEINPQTVTVGMEYTGHIAGVRDAEVRARVTGILLRRNYVEGAAVKAKQSLFDIDPAPYRVALSSAEAELASTEARHAQAVRDVTRFEALLERKAISQKNYDDAVSSEQITKAEVQAASAKVADARLKLGYTRVDAPISGITGRIQVTEGTLISGPEVLLTTITQTSPIYAIAAVSDNDHLRINHDVQAGRLQLPKDGKFDVSIKLSDGTVYGHTGKVNFSDIRLNPETGTSEVRAVFPNPNGVLRPGQFVRVTLNGGKRVNALLVPQRAVLEGPEGKFVYVVDKEGKAKVSPVQVGDWTDEQWVINQGLAAGDKVIVDGVLKIGPGAPVKAELLDQANSKAG